MSIDSAFPGLSAVAKSVFQGADSEFLTDRRLVELVELAIQRAAEEWRSFGDGDLWRVLPELAELSGYRVGGAMPSGPRAYVKVSMDLPNGRTVAGVGTVALPDIRNTLPEVFAAFPSLSVYVLVTKDASDDLRDMEGQRVEVLGVNDYVRCIVVLLVYEVLAQYYFDTMAFSPGFKDRIRKHVLTRLEMPPSLLDVMLARLREARLTQGRL